MEVANISYEPMKDKQMTSFFVGKPVMRDDRGYKEYGIITGYVNNLVLVHFGNNMYSLRLRAKDLYLITVKKQ